MVAKGVHTIERGTDPPHWRHSLRRADPPATAVAPLSPGRLRDPLLSVVKYWDVQTYFCFYSLCWARGGSV